MRPSKKQGIILILLLSILLIGVGFSIYSKTAPDNVIEEQSVLGEDDDNYREDIIIDFFGDNIGRTLVAEEIDGQLTMTLRDQKWNVVATLQDEMVLYPTTLYKVVQLNKNSDRSYLQWDMAVGPHQVETVFLTVIDNIIQPIYSFDFQTKTMIMPFYISRGQLEVSDFDEDGLVEVFEFVDEFPPEAPRLEDENIEEKIREEFSTANLGYDVSDDVVKIMVRENYGLGRGKSAVKAVHSFVDSEVPFFRKLNGEEYENTGGKLVDGMNEAFLQTEGIEKFIRYNDITQNAKEFNSFVRVFWTRGRPFETPFPEDN